MRLRSWKAAWTPASATTNSELLWSNTSTAAVFVSHQRMVGRYTSVNCVCLRACVRVRAGCTTHSIHYASCGFTSCSCFSRTTRWNTYMLKATVITLQRGGSRHRQTLKRGTP